MATEKQIAANRANAKRSTGPKTKRGRRASSSNALRHGLSSPRHQQLSPVDLGTLTAALLPQAGSELQIIAASQVVQAHLDVLQVRAVRATTLSLLDPHNCSADDLRRLLAIDRYERIARARRRKATSRLYSE
jgi:hypothetical protein